ncbi:MAG: hypothetical protein AAFV97_03145 [Bacteroidota bacterium]
MLFYLFIGLLGLCCPSSALAASSPTGTIREAEFIIEKEKEHRFPESARLFAKAPLPTYTSYASQQLIYYFREIQPTGYLLPYKSKLSSIKPEMQAKHYPYYLHLGHGNRYAPYLEGLLYSQRVDQARYFYTLHLRHTSRGAHGYFEEAHHSAQAYGQACTDTLLWEGAISYAWDQYPHIEPVGSLVHLGPRRLPAPRFNQIRCHGTLTSRPKVRVQYQAQVQGSYVSSPWDSLEKQGSLCGEVGAQVRPDLRLHITADSYLTQYKHRIAISRHLGRCKPTLHLLLQHLEIELGGNVVYQNERSTLVRNCNLYPLFKIQGTSSPQIRPYLELGGDIQRTSWETFVSENPWIAPGADIRHANQRFILCGGTHGNLRSDIHFHTGLSTAHYENFPCFVNQATDPRQLDVVYAPAALVNHAFGELTQGSPLSKLTTHIRADYWHYRLKQLSHPWHRPTYALHISSMYRGYEKLSCTGSLAWLGGIVAYDIAKQKIYRLEPILDLGCSLAYAWSKQLTIGLDVKNLLNREQPFYRYTPAYKCQWLLHFTFMW